MTQVETQTVAWAPWIWGVDTVPFDDPAETFHEASRMYPRVSLQTTGATLLAHDERLRASTLRATKRTAFSRAALPLPARSARAWDDVVAARRTSRAYAAAAVSPELVAALLHAAYGVTGDDAGLPLRTTPSGGALFPLELYVLAARVDDVEAGVHHFDPFRNALELVSARDLRDELTAASPYPDLLADAALVVLITAMFWRTRFKYGLRGYRFALLEAGHVAQNLLLAAAAHDLAAAPVGGFYDRHLDAVVGADGLDEACIYALSVGVPA